MKPVTLARIGLLLVFSAPNVVTATEFDVK